MKNTVLAALAAVAAPIVAGADAGEVPEWENPQVNSINRLPAATFAMPLADEAAALTDALEPETPYAMSLDGIWKFRWTGDPARCPADFWKAGFDDSSWADIDVPSCVEMRGWGVPIYTNIRYPHKLEWPKILDRETGRADYNPVSSYRRRFSLPDSWKGRETILRFDGVYSAYYVWVNGEFAGYAEDSKLPSEFDVTRLVRFGAENEIAVRVYRWCDGSYLEDQDMFRFSGIFRSVSLWSRPAEGGVADFTCRTAFDGGYENATLSVDVMTYGRAEKVSAALYAPGGDGVPLRAETRPEDGRGGATLEFRVPGVKPWSAEKPDLYTLVVRAGGDVRSKRIGFKEQKIVGNAFFVNGRKVKFKGVNRHETSPENGRTVSLEEMVRDITLMKRYNIDTVRTSHYPNHRLWYALCDRYGIYVVAEANVEGHEPGYKEEGLGNFPEWDATIVERNVRQVMFYRDNPCVTMWSMGNETGHGNCFRNAIAAVKELDPSRPVHWECGNVDADVDARMYMEVGWLDERGRMGDEPFGSRTVPDERGRPWRDQTAGKPFFMSEYAHAMGNAMGNFAEYWDVFYRHDALCGGCIWDWIDQAVWKRTGRVDPATGREERYLAYGGDFDESPNDGPFCVNGVIDPLRTVTPKLVEVGHVHRNLVTSRRDDGTLELWNRFAFTRADEFAGRWRLLEDGAAVASGVLEVPPLAPLSHGAVSAPGLADAEARLDPAKEHFLDVEYSTKASSAWADAGWIVARDQIALPGGSGIPSRSAAPGEPRYSEKDGVAVVECAGTRAVFDLAGGAAAELVLANGARAFSPPAPGMAAGPRLTCARAFTDNDKWIAKRFFPSGLSQLSYTCTGHSFADGTLSLSVDVAGAKGCGFAHESRWTFLSDGSVEIWNRVEPYGTMPEALPRLGLTMSLDPSLENVRWYGRGPWENYVDRCAGSFAGVWESTVADMFTDYVRPQENGGRSGARWVEFYAADGRGVRFVPSSPAFFRALHYGWEDLHFARHQKGALRHRTPLVPRRETVLDLDVRQTGLGGGSCGPKPLDEYRFDPLEPVEWTVRVEPAPRR